MAKSDYKPYSANGANAEETTPSMFALTLFILKVTNSKYVVDKTGPDKVDRTQGHMKALFYKTCFWMN